MPQLLFPEWRSETAHLKFPFADSATLTNGDLELPEWLFLDGRLYPVGGGDGLYVSRVARDGKEVAFTLGIEGNLALAAAVYDLTAVPDNGEIVFEDDYDRPAGILVSTKQALSAFGAFSQGNYDFTVDQTRFAASVVVPQPDLGVRGILTDDGDVLAGDIWLVGENGVVLREEDGAVRVDIVGDPFAARKLCTDEEPQDDPGAGGSESILGTYWPVFTINGYSPDRYGNFELRVGANQSLTALLRIVPIADGVLKLELLGQRRFQGV